MVESLLPVSDLGHVLYPLKQPGGVEALNGGLPLTFL